MSYFLRAVLVAFQALVVPSTVMADDMLVENFALQPEARWRFFTDGVMGGVSNGQVDFVREGDHVHAHMTGTVSTANNGGFIQIRMDLPDAPADASGVRLLVRGNDQQYYVHLRTSGTILPWQYYQAGFPVTDDWTEVRLPFSDFEPSGRLLRRVPRADSLRSVGIVAYGRDHQAEIDVREVAFY
tara:strand:+ start:7354 stop:7908 length:555 start_codon:yes stop_codon:yes gene_type:complete